MPDEEADAAGLAAINRYDLPASAIIPSATGAVPVPAVANSAQAVATAPIASVLDFGHVITLLRVGKRLGRVGWNGKDMWLALQTPDTNSKMSHPYIYMKTVDNDLVPWVASQSDLLASDWQIIEGQPDVG